MLQFLLYSLHYEMTPIYMGDNNEIDRVASPESVLIHLDDIFVVVSLHFDVPLIVFLKIIENCILAISCTPFVVDNS